MSHDRGELSDRKKLILKAIVDAHIADGEPIGSKSILENKQLTCSAATIRNEMAELEAMGYLEQPHTSAGRVPSELGYRFYVDSLIEHYVMTTREISEIHARMKDKMAELDQILTTASKVASSLTQYTGFALKPKSSTSTVQRFETIFIDSQNFVLIMVMTDNHVETKNIKMNYPIDAEAISKLGAALNHHIKGLTANEITLPMIMEVEKEMGSDAGMVTPVIKIVYQVMNQSDSGEMSLTGLNHLLQYPEYSDVGQLQELLGTIENKEEIMDLVIKNQDDDTGVLIGSETSVKVLNNSTLVFKPIKKEGKTIGAVGIIGPVRMDYAKVLATLEGISDDISDMLNDQKQLNGGDPR